MTTKTENYFELQRRAVWGENAGVWESVLSANDEPDKTLQSARETYNSFVSQYDFYHPGRYEFRTVYVTVKTTEKPMDWGKV